MKWALVDSQNIVQNTIDYDPLEPYGPYSAPAGLILMQINDWIEIGQDTQTPDPSQVL